jgi:hypothetical protein
MSANTHEKFDFLRAEGDSRKMKKLLFVTLLMVGLICPFSFAKGGHSSGYPGHSGVSVKGYFKSNGTYVTPYQRSTPDSTPANNWSSKSDSNSLPAIDNNPILYSGIADKKDAAYSRKSVVYGIQRDANGQITRSSAARAEFMRETGFPDGRPGYIVDHITPLYKGGADLPSNMQWQTVEEAKKKDTWE